MKILVINSGSSSIKLELLQMTGEVALAAVQIERIGESTGHLSYVVKPKSADEKTIESSEHFADHKSAMRVALNYLADQEHGVIRDPAEISAVGHRVVHGGEEFRRPIVIDEDVLRVVEKNIPLAPLHNPANLDGIRVAQELFPGVLQVAVFDTAFHQTIPAEAFLYAIPYELYTSQHIRRYGFHGTSHKFVAEECAKAMGRPLDEINLITVHLGNGCSMTAVEKGRSVDCSLGFTPLEGLVMGTRCGDLDPAMHVYLARTCNMDLEEIDRMLNKQSGLKGLCGYNDMRDIHTAIEAGDERAALALGVQTHRNKRYIGAFMAVLGRVDAIVFTAGIGENDSIVRQRSLAGLEHLGIVLDPEANSGRIKKPKKISSPDSRIEVWTIPTNEELAIARETKRLFQRAVDEEV